MQDNIFDPMQWILNLPMVADELGKVGSTGEEGTNEPASLMIRMTRARARLLDTNGRANTRPVWLELTRTVIDSDNPSDLTTAVTFMAGPSLLRGLFQTHF